jgi:purine-binding chemotaxis protein CheW
MLSTTESNAVKGENKKETDKYIIFSINGQKFGINVMDSREIIQLDEITPVPDSPDFVKGVIDLRDKITPIVNIRKKFNFEGTKRKNDKFIVVSVNDKLVGIDVDELDGINTINLESIQSAPEITRKSTCDYIKGVGKIAGNLIILLNIHKMFSAKEINELENIN